MQIGAKIKYFREKMGVTQAYLAEQMRVSTQAVSKWETGASYPDITIIPALADFFKISCDALLTDGTKTETQLITELQQVTEKWDVSTRNGYFSRLSFLEDALERYPRSNKFMLDLAYMYGTGAEFPEYKMFGWKDRIIDYCECVYANSDTLQEKFEAMTLLCYIYSGTNNDRVIEIANQMPQIYQSKPALIYHGYEGEQKFERMCEYFSELLDTSYSMLCCLIGSNSEIDEMYRAIRNESCRRDKWNINR
ncbi:MAG: helix-turn-helix transcriptional regulator [Clostridia bacterium]|nr:helix-turn-helix transcriptional regulator [Clostridia bacterium]